MTRPYLRDLRERMLRADLDGEPIRSVAARLGVSVSSVPKRVARYRTTGSVAPGRIGDHRRWLLEPHRERAHAGGGDAAPDPRPAAGAAGERRHHGVPGHDLAVPAPRGPALRKKAVRPRADAGGSGPQACAVAGAAAPAGSGPSAVARRRFARPDRRRTESFPAVSGRRQILVRSASCRRRDPVQSLHARESLV